MSFGNDHEPSQRAARCFARDLRRRRYERGLPRFVLAQRLSVPDDVLDAWENGRNFPETPALAHWMEALGLSLYLAAITSEARS